METLVDLLIQYKLSKTVFHDEENTFSSVIRDFVYLLLDNARMFVS